MDRWQTTLKLAIKGERVIHWYIHSPFKFRGGIINYDKIYHRRSPAYCYELREGLSETSGEQGIHNSI